MRETKTLILHIEVTDESIRTAEQRENFFKGYINSIPGVKIVKTEVIWIFRVNYLEQIVAKR